MIDLIMEIVASVTTSAVVTAGLVYLTKSYLSEKIKNSISYEYSLKLDSHKDELQRNSNKELEELKAQLKINELKQNIKLSALHEKQAETVEILHQELWALFDALNDYTTVFQARSGVEKENKRLVVADNLDSLKNTLRSKALYIPEALHEELDETKNDIQKTAVSFMEKVERESGSEMIKEWDTIHKTVNENIRNTVRSLENEFRSILGAS